MKTSLRIPYLVLMAWIAMLASFSISARDYPTDQQMRIEELAKSRKPTTDIFVDEAGYTHWRSTINSGCSFSDHNYSLDIQTEPKDMSNVSYSMSNYDVDYNTQGCPGGPEVDRMHFNGQDLGTLTGADGSWSINTFPLTNTQVVKGSNSIFIDTDSTNTGCWCVGVGYIEVVAKVGFTVLSHTPADNEKNRDFHFLNLDLNVQFSNEYDPATLTDATFILEYLDNNGSWQQATGLFNQTGPKAFKFLPDFDLLDGVKYRATIKGGDTGVKSLQGEKLEKDFQWSFWTVPDLDISDTFGGKVCVPEPGPCPGLEVAVFQVSRNAALVEGKDTVARVFARWKKHDDVSDEYQVKDLEAEFALTGGGVNKTQRATVKRPDLYTADDRKAAKESVNIYHTPTSNAQYTVKVKAIPQSNTQPVEYYSNKLSLGKTNSAPNFTLNYYFLPGADLAAGRDIMTEGAAFITDNFPLLQTTPSDKGELKVEYTIKGNTNHPVCGNVNKVSCPGHAVEMTEYQCVLEHLNQIKGTSKFLAAVTPAGFCPGAFGVASGGAFLYFQVNPHVGTFSTVAHELGHVYSLPDKNAPADDANVEGFQVRLKHNRSYTADKTGVASLMHQGQSAARRWIKQDDYGTLLTTVTGGITAPSTRAIDIPGEMSAASATGYLIVDGVVDLSAGTGSLATAYVQADAQYAPEPGGVCRIDLRSAGGAVLSSFPFNPQAEEFSEGAQIMNTGLQLFNASVPWDDTATELQLLCNGALLASRSRTVIAPEVAFDGLNNGATLTGVATIKWQGTDADGPGLSYQLQFSTDNGASWTKLTPIINSNQFQLDTTRLPSTPSGLLGIMATDGFNTDYATVQVVVSNGLGIHGTLPSDLATNVNVNTPITVFFVSPLNAATLTDTSFRVTAAGQAIAGKLSYDPLARKATFVPNEKLKYSTQYQVELTAALSDEQGNALTPVTWLFTTAADDEAPTVKKVYPGSGETNIPVNSLIQVDYSEAVNPATVTAQSFMVRDKNGADVAGQLNMLASSEGTVFVPAQNLESNSHYTVALTKDITDLAGLPLSQAFNSSFVTGSTTMSTHKLVGNYLDQAKDDDADGFFDRLVISVGVQVTQAGNYNLNGRLLTQDRNLIQWSTTGDIYLNVGVHTLALEFKASPIRNSGINGPYILDALNFYPSSNPNLGDVAYDAFLTYPYDVAKFFSIMTLGPLPNQLLKVDTVKDNAINLPALTTHRTDPVNTVKYSLLINALPQAGVTIDSDNNIDINPQAGTESESDVTVQAVDQNSNRVQSTFHVGVQKPAPGSLVMGYVSTMNANTGQTLTVDIFDQFGDKYLALTTVSFSSTLGSFSAASVDTNTGRATVVFNAGAAAGDAFITVKAGKAETIEKIKIVKSAAFMVTPSAGVGGSVTPNTPQQVTAGKTLTLTVVANNDYSLDTAVGGTCPKGGWNGHLWTTGAINANCTVSFSFTPIPIVRYTVTPSAGEGGSVSPAIPQTVNAGGTLSFTVLTTSGYIRESVVGGSCPQGNWNGEVWTTGAINANCTVSFSFSPIVYPGPHKVLSVKLKSKKGGQGTVVSDPPGMNCAPKCSYEFTQKAKITLIAKPAAGSVFKGWSGACTGKKTSCSVKLKSNRKVTAIFKTK